jgi:REP element-mobilizing transposase RayT
MPSTYSNLIYHIVFATKSRAALIEADWMDRLHRYLAGTVNEMDGKALEVGGISDHIHLLVVLRPSHCVADFVRDLKKESSKFVHRGPCPPRLRMAGWVRRLHRRRGEGGGPSPLHPKPRRPPPHGELPGRAPAAMPRGRSRGRPALLRITVAPRPGCWLRTPWSRGAAALYPWLPCGTPIGVGTSHRERARERAMRHSNSPPIHLASHGSAHRALSGAGG